MKQYVDLLDKIINTGQKRLDRTGVGTISVFGGQIEFDLDKCFPLVTIKKTLWKSAFIEMLWFLRGEPNTHFLKKYNVKIWDDWADKDGNLGPIYGVQWRKWPGKTFKAVGDQRWNVKPGSINVNCIAPQTSVVFEPPIDQIKQLIERIKTKPQDRRLIVTAWNPTFIEEMGLPPCHRDFQCYVTNDGKLDLMMAQRSWDVGLGAPFNIAQYALLNHLLCRATNLKPGRLIINYGDAHIYSNHINEISDWLSKYSIINCLPKLIIKTENIDIDGYNPEDFDIIGYESNPLLKLKIAV